MTRFETRSPDWLSVKDALSRILGQVEPLESERIPVEEALGRVLAEGVLARAALPPWDNSAMDGYAVRATDLAGASREKPARGKRKRGEGASGIPLQLYRIEVGREHGAEARNIVGAIANEAGLDHQYIGHVKLHDTFSTVELPEGMPKDVFKHLKRVWVSGRQLNITLDEPPRDRSTVRKRPDKGKGGSAKQKRAKSKQRTTRPKDR